MKTIRIIQILSLFFPIISYGQICKDGNMVTMPLHDYRIIRQTLLNADTLINQQHEIMDSLYVKESRQDTIISNQKIQLDTCKDVVKSKDNLLKESKVLLDNKNLELIEAKKKYGLNLKKTKLILIGTVIIEVIIIKLIR